MVTRDVDEECERVEWDGLSGLAAKHMESYEFALQQRYPTMCLNLMLAQSREQAVGLRPYDEI